jgi:hypothetical protein
MQCSISEIRQGFYLGKLHINSPPTQILSTLIKSYCDEYGVCYATALKYMYITKRDVSIC